MLILWFIAGALIVIALFYVQSLRESLALARQNELKRTQDCLSWQYRFQRNLEWYNKNIQDLRKNAFESATNRRLQLYIVSNRLEENSRPFMVVVSYHLTPPIIQLESYYPRERFCCIPLGRDFTHLVGYPSTIAKLGQCRLADLTEAVYFNP